MRLWPDRALDWDSTLFIADPHFGKSSTLQSFGLAAPDPTSHDLQRLQLLLRESDCRRLVVLGDFFHARAGRSPAVLDDLARWRSQHAGLEIVLIRGNHDRSAGDPPSSLEIQCFDEGWRLGPFDCRHEPPTTAGADEHTLAGHLHPGFLLRDRSGSRLRSPCFVVGRSLTLLPAFGTFTGLHLIQPSPEVRIFLPAPPGVIELPRSPSPGRPRPANPPINPRPES